jgi:hypothetical protein
MSAAYIGILEKALSINLTASEYEALESRLSIMRGEINPKTDLDILIENTTLASAPFKVTLASIVAKLHKPEWDTREHQVQIGGKASLRTVDTHICEFLCMKRLYDTNTAGALTRSFEKKEPYNREYSGSITPAACRDPFLNIVELINTGADDKALLNDMLVYMLSFLKRRLDQVGVLQNTIVICSKQLRIIDVESALNKLHSLGAGSSPVPVIAGFTILFIVQPYFWPTISILPLKGHTTADSQSDSCGDIEAVDASSKPVIAIEVKHQIPIKDSIIHTFDNKTNGKNIPIKFIISTSKTEKRFTENNTCIDSVNGFVTTHLQMALFHEKNICSIFLEELRKQIMNYSNLNVNIKEAADKILKELLVSPSP